MAIDRPITILELISVLAMFVSDNEDYFIDGIDVSRDAIRVRTCGYGTIELPIGTIEDSAE